MELSVPAVTVAVKGQIVVCCAKVDVIYLHQQNISEFKS